MIANVAVIGGGVFGCVIASELSRLGLEVALFEKKSDLISGSTVESVSRLHLGLHYPRDMRTAKQSIEGFNEFVSEFPEAVDRGFTNFYALSSFNSKVTEGEFRNFALEAGAPFEEVEKGELSRFGFNIDSIISLFASPEGVIDNGVLRSVLKSRLASQAVTVSTSSEIGKVERKNTGWRLLDTSEESKGTFDLVILSTYALDTLQITNAPLSARREYEFQNTLVIAATLPDQEKLGVTVVDGDFLTLLPVAFRSRHLIYAPGPSVLTREIGIQPSSRTLAGPSSEQLDLGVKRILQRLAEYFPGSQPENLEVVPGKRAIEAYVQTTDRRQTSVLELGPNFLSVASGKIDHCFIAARQIKQMISSGRVG